MTWDWQVFLSDDGSGRTYLQWMIDAWGWTLAVAGGSLTGGSGGVGGSTQTGGSGGATGGSGGATGGAGGATGGSRAIRGRGGHVLPAGTRQGVGGTPRRPDQASWAT